MSVTEDITIMEYMTPNDYDGVETIVTNETGKSNLIWVPWAARRHVGVLEVSHNGEYVAADEGLFGWTKVNVLVAGGSGAEMEVVQADGTTRDEWVEAPASTIEDDVGYGSGAIIGEYGGVTYIVTLDDDGNLVWTPTEGEEGDKVWVDENTMNAINDALKSKTGATDDYEPSEMPSAIRGIRVCTMTLADEGKVVHNGQLVAQTSLRVIENGTYDTTTYDEVTVTVQSGRNLNPTNLGYVVVNTESGYDLIQQTSRTITANGTYDTTTNNEVVADVANTYGAGDVGKKVVEEDGEYFLVPIYPSDEDGKVWIDADVMAAINNAIKGKTGETTDYDPNDMPDAIRGLASATLGTKSVTENGTYAATSDGYDGYLRVTVNVQSDGSDPAQEGKVWIDTDVIDDINEAIKNKTGATTDYDPEDMADAIRSIVTAVLGTKSITENGTYSASSDGYDGYSQVQVNVSSGGSDPTPVTTVNLPYSDSEDILSEATLDNYSNLIEVDLSKYWGSNSSNNEYNYELPGGHHLYDDTEGAVAIYGCGHSSANGIELERFSGSGLSTTGFTVYAVVRPINPASGAVIASTASSYDVATIKDGIVLAGSPVSVYVGSSGEATTVATNDGYFVMAITGAGTSGKAFLMDEDHTSGVIVSKTTNAFGWRFSLTSRPATTTFTTDDPTGTCDLFVRYVGLVNGQESDSVILQNMTNLMDLYLDDEDTPIFLPYTYRSSINVSCPYYTYDATSHEWESVSPPVYSTDLQDGTVSVVSMPVIANDPSAVTLQSDGLYATGGETTAAFTCTLSLGLNWGVFYVVMKYVEAGSGVNRKSGISLIQESSNYVMANIFAESGRWYCVGNGGTGTQQLYSSNSDAYSVFAIAFVREGSTSSTDSAIKYYSIESTSPMSTVSTSGTSLSEARLATNCECAYKYFAVSTNQEDDDTISRNLSDLYRKFVTGGL